MEGRPVELGGNGDGEAGDVVAGDFELFPPGGVGGPYQVAVVSEEGGGGAGGVAGVVAAVDADDDVRLFSRCVQEVVFDEETLEGEGAVGAADGGAGSEEPPGACGGADAEQKDMGIGLGWLAVRQVYGSAQVEAADFAEGQGGGACRAVRRLGLRRRGRSLRACDSRIPASRRTGWA